MHRAILNVAAALLLAVPALALPQAPEITFFGPKLYDHPDSEEVRALDAVTVPADVTGPFTLRVQNGEARDGVHHGTVILNGVTVLDKHDFDSKTVQLELAVQLQPVNELVVVIRGRPRTHLTLSISGRLVPPVPTGLAPDPLKVSAGATANVVATLVPTPRFGGALSVATADASIATAPASVAFAAGEALVSIPIAGVKLGSTTLTASLNGASASSRIDVVLAISPASGAAGTLVTLTGMPFDTPPGANLVLFAGAGGAPLNAAVIAASASLVTARVPEGAVSGPIAVASSRGTAQSARFTVTELSTRLAATAARITELSGTSSSLVTPFVQGADPWDAFSFLVLAPPANGTASVIGNKLAYLSNSGFSGLDAFPYQLVAGDGSTLDGTARVRVFTADALGTADTPGRCLARSVPDATRTPPAIRNNVTACAIYGEVVTRRTASGDPVTVKYVAMRPSSGATPQAAVFLIGGTDLGMGLSGDPASGDVTATGGNFVVRSAQVFAEAGYLAVAMDRPSDQPVGPSTDDVANVDRYRISVDHAVDILALLRETNTDNLDVFLAGISRGAVSAVANNLIAAGISLHSPITRASGNFPDRLFINQATVASLLPSFVKRPTEVLRNITDAPPAGCLVARPADSLTLATNLQNLGIPTTLDSVSGGFSAEPDDPCGGLTLHAFLGIEPTAVGRITTWLNGRVVALAGNKRPLAAFASLVATSSALPLSIDLGPLALDPDGDPLAYALSHARTVRGGSVTLSASTVTYTPPAGMTQGTDYFVYVVTDGRGGVGSAVIAIQIGG